jgi:hypothetical protein
VPLPVTVLAAALPLLLPCGLAAAVATTEYGSKLHVWNWRERSLRQTIDLGPDGLIPLETRFFHNPKSPIGFVVSNTSGWLAC